MGSELCYKDTENKILTMEVALLAKKSAGGHRLGFG